MSADPVPHDLKRLTITAIVLLVAFLPAVTAANTGIISVVSTPPGAKVFVDGSYEGTTPWKGIFPPGTYALRLTHPEYAGYETIVVLQPLELKDLNIRMGALTPLSVTSSPDGANVYLDGIWQGYTNLEIASVSPGGSYAVRIVREGYEPYETTVVIQKNARIHADLVPLGTIGTLSVTSVPSEARVLIDGAMAGLTPFAGTVATGTHTVTVRKIRYDDFTTTVTVGDGKTTTVSAVLNLAARADVQSAAVSILSTPPRASVYIGGVYYGPAPVAADLEPATHAIRVSLPGYTDYALNVTVAAGESLPVYANLGGGSATSAGTQAAPGTGAASPQATRAPGFGWVPALAIAAAGIALLKKER